MGEKEDQEATQGCSEYPTLFYRTEPAPKKTANTYSTTTKGLTT